MRTIVLDSGAFIAVERRDRSFAAFIQAADNENAEIVIPATVIAEVWRDPPRHQSNALIRAADAVVSLSGETARAVGALLGRSNTTQLVDAHVVMVAIAAKPSIVVTSDPGDLIALLRAAGVSCSTNGTSKSDVIVRTV